MEQKDPKLDVIDPFGRSVPNRDEMSQNGKFQAPGDEETLRLVLKTEILRARVATTKNA
jgi:hypothetical protein